MFRNACYDRQNDFNMNNEFNAENMSVDIDVAMNNNQMMGSNVAMGGTTQGPVMEPAQERQVHRTFMHEVQHVCPIRTRVINHHVFRHTYRPCYSCCEENVCSQVQCGSCCNFR